MDTYQLGHIVHLVSLQLAHDEDFGAVGDSTASEFEVTFDDKNVQYPRAKFPFAGPPKK